MKTIVIKTRVHGLVNVMVDNKYFNILNKRRWGVTKYRDSFYIRTAKKPRVYIHRLILGITDPKIIVDHIDRNPANNQRKNLRVVSSSQSNSNRSGTGYSKYLGVFFRADTKKDYKKKWYSRITKNGIIKHLGSFTTQEKAALAYNRAARIIHGKFANLNVIEKPDLPGNGDTDNGG